MTRQIINTGSDELAGDGESIRVAFTKVNDNFEELYNLTDGEISTDIKGSVFGNDSSLIVDGNNGDLYTNNIYLGGHPLRVNLGGILTLDDNPITGGGGDRLTNGIHELVLNVNGTTPYVTFPSHLNQYVAIQGNEINVVGQAVLISTNNKVLLVANADGLQKIWRFGTDGTLSVPVPTPSIFTLTFAESNYVATGPKPTLTLTDDPWELHGEYQYNQDGDCELLLDNIWPQLVNPGYTSGDSFTFDESVHGIVGYTLTVQLDDIVQAGPAGWTANVEVSQGPEYPATIIANGAIKFTANDKSWVFSTDGGIRFSDYSKQTTAYRYSATDVAPLISAGALWFNSNEGRLYINYNDTWIEASPTQIDPSAIRFNDLGQIELPDGGGIVDSNGNTLLDRLVAGSNSVVLDGNGILTLPQNGIINSLSGISMSTGRGQVNFGYDIEQPGLASHFHINSADTNNVDLFFGDDSNYVKLPKSPEYGVEIGAGGANVWRFGTDGNLTFPNGALTVTGNKIRNVTAVEGLSAGSQLEVSQTKTVITNGVTTSLGEGGPSLISQSLFEVSTNGILSSFQVINSLGEGDPTLTSEYLTELSNNSFKIGQRVTNDLGDSSEPLVVFSGWTFGIDGTLALPTGGLISNYPGGTGANNDSWFVTPGTGTGGVSSQDGQQYIQINNNLFVEIGTSYGTENASAWTFGTDGALTLPAGSTLGETLEIVTVTLDQFTDGGYPGTQVFTKVSNTRYELLSTGPYIELIGGRWKLKISVSVYYDSPDLITWTALGGGLPEPVGTLGTLATMNLGVGSSGWGFSGDGDLTLPEGSTISETNTTTVITPPGALAGQSLVIRPTSAFGLTASGYIVAGTNLTITLTNISSITSLQFNYTITGATPQQLGVGSLTGSFPVLSPGTSPQSSSIVLPIPGNSNATTFTLTIDSDQNLGAANTTITVTDNGVTNSETSHIHLMSGNPITTDIYLGDDDQYVKIEKNAGNVVIGTNTNTNHWTFGTDSKLSIPNDASIHSIDNQASAIIATNVTWDSNDPYTPGRFGSAVFDGNADFTNPDATILNIIDGANKTFTIEGWILRDLTGHAPNYYGEFIIGDIGGASGTDVEWSVSIAEHGKLIFVVNGNGGSAAALGDTIMLEQAWYHFAVVVNNGAIKLFVGGLLQSITGDSTITHWPGNHFTPHSLRIGQWYDIYHSFYGNMSGLRVVQGTAVYTSTFTPSVTPLSYIQGTTLLLLFKNDTSLTENTVNNGLELTRGGNSWTFGTDRQLKLPSIISGYEATIGPVLDVGTVLQAQESLWVASTLDVKIQVNNDVAGQKTWEFWTNGITFPDTTLQSTAFQDIPSHIYFVHPNPGPRVYTETGTYNSPFKTINAAVNAAMTAGHQDSDPATIILMASITENITLKPGIYLTSLGTGTHGSPNITGTITVNSTTGGLVANHYSISNLRIVAPSDITNCINFTGTAPQRLFLRDMWLDARGTGTGIMMDNTDSTSALQMDIAHLAHSGTGDIYCIDVTHGNCYITDIETSGNVQVAAVRAGTTMTINGSELDGNNEATIEVYGGALTITNSIITNSQSNSSGIKLNTTGSVLTLGNCIMTIPAGSGKAVYGVATTYMYYANVFFTPGSNTSKTASPTLISTLLSSTWT